MAKTPTRQTGQFEYRVGVDGFAFKGMMMDPDPGALPPDRPRYVLNGRYQGGAIISRPPYEPFVAIPEFTRERITGGTHYVDTDYWDLQYFAEHHSSYPVRLWYAGSGPLAGSGLGGFIGFIDLEASPPMQQVGEYWQSSNRCPAIARFDNDVYVGDYGFLRKIHQIKTPYGVTPTAYATLPADDIIWNFAGLVVDVLHTHLGKLYMLVVDPLGVSNGTIWSWDGATFALEYTLSIPGINGAAAASWRDRLVFTIRGLGSILVRAASGTWSTVTVGGFNSSPKRNSMASTCAGIFIMDGTDKIYLYNGTTLALYCTIVGGAPNVAEKAECCALLGERVWFGWSKYNPGAAPPKVRDCYLGAIDPDVASVTQTVVHYAPFGSSVTNWVNAMAVHRGKLFTLVDTTYPVVICHKDNYNPNGPSTVNLGSYAPGGTNLKIDYMVSI